MKKFYALSSRKERPWQGVFGMTMETLEADWIKALQTYEKTNDENASTLSKLFERNPNTACLQAQELVARKQ